jgi:hypothetical protein
MFLTVFPRKERNHRLLSDNHVEIHYGLLMYSSCDEIIAIRG